MRELDASRLASGGSSAGDHLALVAALIAAHAPVPAPEPGVAAVVALNPVVIEQDAGIAAGRAIDYSPIEFVQPGNPPVLIQHGTHDRVAPIHHVRWFRNAMVQAGNECVLLECEDAEYAFHYPGPTGHFDDVVDATAELLLASLAAD